MPHSHAIFQRNRTQSEHRFEQLSQMNRYLLSSSLLALVLVAQGAAALARPDLVLRATALVCEFPDGDIEAMARALDDVDAYEEEAIERANTRLGTRWRFLFTWGDVLVLERFALGDVVRSVSARYDQRVGPGEGEQPQLLALFDGACAFRAARELGYDANGKAELLYELDASLRRTGAPALLNPPVPVLEPATDDGVRVAVVDSGVNYLLPEIRERLARDERGRALGYDFWDMDDRPYDAHPTGSAFFVQRHGTQTASLLLSESPVASLVPYRYPRPDMSRMAQLLDDARSKGVRIANLSMGGNRREEWEVFARAARLYPDILFVFSAGNDARDIDEQPVYPASLDLPNSVTVTSSLGSGALAQGSNWGLKSVDLAVPAEEMLVLGYEGRTRVASGSSYGAIRVTALAACLLAENPQWDVARLKTEIVSLASPEPGSAYTAHGVLPDTDTIARGACKPARTEVQRVGSYQLELRTPHQERAYTLRPTLVLIRETGWSMAEIRTASREAARILGQCGIDMRSVTLDILAVPEPLKFFRDDMATMLVRRHPVTRPAVFFVKDTLQTIEFEGEAIGRANSHARPELADSVWLVNDVQRPGVALAHELVHVLADSGAHVEDAGNLMHETTSDGGHGLSRDQCERLVTVGLAHELLRPVDR